MQPERNKTPLTPVGIAERPDIGQEIVNDDLTYDIWPPKKRKSGCKTSHWMQIRRKEKKEELECATGF
jgi:hypothetical protein